MKVKISLIVLILSMSISCNQKEDNASENEIKKKKFEISYRYKGRRCTTGNHSFSEDSKETLFNNLCTALQDDELNFSCAHKKRKKSFKVHCQGQEWTPTKTQDIDPEIVVNEDNEPEVDNPDSNDEVESTDTNEEENSDVPGVSNEDNTEKPDTTTPEKAKKLREYLVDLTGTDFHLSSDITRKNQKLANKIIKEFLDCGISFTGPNCIDRYVVNSKNAGQLYTKGKKKVFYIQLPYKMYYASIGLFFKLKKIGKKYLAQSVIVYKVIKENNNEFDLGRILNDKTFTNELFTIQISNNPQSILLKQLKSPRNLKMLYHSLNTLQRMKKSKKDLVEELKSNMDLIGSSMNELYQYKILSYIQDVLQVDKTTFLMICNKLIKNFNIDVKMYGSVYLYLNDSSLKRLKSNVIRALRHLKWEIRIKAIEALTNGVATARDQNEVIKRLNDKSKKVRTVAIRVISNMRLDRNNKKALKRIIKNSKDMEIQNFAKQLLAQIYKS